MIKFKTFYLDTNNVDNVNDIVNNWLQKARIKRILNFSSEITRSASYQVITILYEEIDKENNEEFILVNQFDNEEIDKINFNWTDYLKTINSSTNYEQNIL